VKRVFIIILAFTSIICCSFAFNDVARYDNLQVLPKDTDKYQLDSVMKHFNTSLGINCDFCHVQLNNAMKDWDFASDSNVNKLVARDMLKMTFKINKEDFGIQHAGKYGTKLEVTCFTCHNGKTHPRQFPKANAFPFKQ
jgi:hypothetical protein